ncbi:uncharacterized protein [Littorina saxatilis]|uniref:Ig-like domain-containing protein n=1 Tax=Littorina saxatilis TaxID=31220 RepID=A0AAN9BIJ6_9CAEN
MTTTGGHVDQVSLWVDVTYDPSLTNLTVPSPVDENASVTIVCFWENGYPPNNSVPDIFDRRGKRFSVKTVSPETHVSYTIDSVQCDDAGNIVCKNSTGESLSKTLLVRCGPSFQTFTDPPVYKVNSGSDLLLEFAVRSHSKEIQLCKFQKGTSPSKPCSNEKLTGSPPDLMFYASFSDVSLSDKGLQTLTLINDVGSGQIEFVISVTEQDANFAKTPLGIFLIVVNAGIVAAITFRVIVKRRQCIALLCRRPATYGNAPIQMQRYPDRQLPLQGQQRERQGEHQPAANRRSTDTTSSNTYESVSDGEVSTVGGSHLCVANTETESTEDEYYLHPVASSGDLHELGDQPLE